MKRREFIQKAAVGTVGVSVGAAVLGCNETTIKKEVIAESDLNKFSAIEPIAICTWRFPEANNTAGKALEEGKSALDAVIEGVAIEENNILNTTVGKGGAPDREGDVTLDACVMSPEGDCGAVLCVKNIKNVASLARKVMEETPHVMLAGAGAESFALAQGFAKENLLTDESKKAWQEWLKTSSYKPIINIENHDTIGMLAIDARGDIAGACTTSGLGYKMAGRVGDSPIVGSGLFLDNEIGGAVATGMGEEVVKTVGSFLIVELMRNGMSPQDACEEAIHRIVKKSDNYKNFQIAYIAINKAGETGAYCIHEGFSMMKYQNKINQDVLVDFYNKA